MVAYNLWCFSLLYLLPHSYNTEIGVQYRLFLSVACKYYTFYTTFD
jgi:hypothetical protein